MKKHLDLFSGIGGFAVAAEEVWPGIEHEFCDIDPFCQEVLRKHWPHATIHGDIRDVTNTADGRRGEGKSVADEEGHAQEPRQTGELAGRPQGSHRIDILTGGFPCQPFSTAGARRGTLDNRHLWPEMLRVIQEFRPRWVVGENVRGLLSIQGGLVFEQVCTDLEAAGYEVQPFVIPAASVNAPHRRDRVWIVAHAVGVGSGGRVGGTAGGDDQRAVHRTPEGQARDDVRSQAQGRGGVAPQPRRDPNTAGAGLEGTQQAVEPRDSGRPATPCAREQHAWDRHWLEVATELCGMDDGLPTGMDRLGLTRSAHRRERLKSLGNAIVPQVAVEVFKAIDAWENTEHNQ